MSSTSGITRFPGHRTAIGLAVSATAAMISSGGAYAAEIEEIVVTATKRSENLQDIPLSVQAFSTDDIRRQRLLGIADYAKKIPALSFSDRQPGGLSVVFRGVSVSGLAFGERSSSCVYLDEQPITAAGRNVNPRLIDIERLEALSGPQGTLFGDSCQSGALRIITNKPNVDDLEGWAETGINQFEEGDAGYGASGAVNVPLVNGKLALRLTGFAEHEAGFIDNVVSPSPGGTFNNADVADNNVNSSDVYGARAALRWQISEEWHADLTGIFEHNERDGFSDINLNTVLDDLEQRRYEDDSLEDEWYQLALGVEGPVAGLDGTLAVSYFDRDFRYEADATDYEFSLQRAACGRYPGACQYYSFYDFGGDPRGYATNHEKTERWSVEARVSTPGDSSSRWSGVAGLFYSKDKGETLFRSYMRNFSSTDFFDYLNDLSVYQNHLPLGPTDAWWVGAYDTEMEQKAAFGELTYAITERIKITAGGRWFDIEDEFGLTQGALQDGWPDPNIGPIYLDTVVDTKESDTVWKGGIKWEIDDDRMLYATYSEGFRGGGGNPIKPGSKLPLSYDSDYLYNYEAGFKSKWLSQSLLFNLTAYHMDWLNIQVQVEDPRPTNFSLGFINFPEASIDGAEAEFQWLIAEEWELTASLAYSNAEISKTSTKFARSGSPQTVRKGTQLPLSPEWKAAVGLQYTVPCKLLEAEPYLKLDYSYSGESYNSIGFQSTIAQDPPARQDDYQLWDFTAGLEAGGWSAQFFINNVADERAQQFFNNRWGFKRLSINDPRSYGLMFRKNF